MKLLVIGATGGVGRHLVTQAHAAGHDVLAAVRDPARVGIDVPVVRVDLADD